MRKKLNSESGLTLVEMLCAVAILVLLVLLLSTGMQMALRTYRDIVAQSEVDLLLSTAVDAIADDLRYAQDVSKSGANFTYTSDSFGKDASIIVSGDEKSKGQIMVGGMRLLPTGAYGLNRAYEVAEMKINPGGLDDSAAKEITFTINLTVKTTDGRISAATPDSGVTVRCLNPKKDATGG